MKAWFAGLWEGEGSISVVKSGKYFQLQIQLNHTDEEVIDLFHANWGGTKTFIDKSKYENRKNAWKWSLVTQQALSFIRDLYPYITSDQEKEVMDLAIAFQEQKLRGGREATDEYREVQRNYYERMAKLNKRRSRRVKT